MQNKKKTAEIVEKRGLKEEGIFRLSGSAKEIEKMKLFVNRGGFISDEPTTSIHNYTGLMKLWFRDLPGLSPFNSKYTKV